MIQNSLADRIAACGRLVVKEWRDGQLEYAQLYLSERTGLEDAGEGTYRPFLFQGKLRDRYLLGHADGTKLRELEQAEVKM